MEGLTNFNFPECSTRENELFWVLKTKQQDKKTKKKIFTNQSPLIAENRYAQKTGCTPTRLTIHRLAKGHMHEKLSAFGDEDLKQYLPSASMPTIHRLAMGYQLSLSNIVASACGSTASASISFYWCMKASCHANALINVVFLEAVCPIGQELAAHQFSAEKRIPLSISEKAN